MIVLLQPTTLVTLRVVYYVPGTHILAPDFVWQLDDRVPEIPRVHRFLNYWHDNIEAVIRDAEVAYGGRGNWRHVND